MRNPVNYTSQFILKEGLMFYVLGNGREGQRKLGKEEEEVN